MPRIINITWIGNPQKFVSGSSFCMKLFMIVIIKCYLKCPLKIKKYAYTCDAIYHHKKVTALQNL